MLTRASFDVFNAETLPERLGRIQREVDPDFEMIGRELLQQVQPLVEEPLYLHIAKHLRRHKNPPVDTWLALSTNKRGYKMLPHFEVGLWPDRLFITLDLLSEMQQRDQIASWLSTNINNYPFAPGLYLSGDHTSKLATPYTLAGAQTLLQRYQSVKKSEFMLGEWILASDHRFDDSNLVNSLISKRINDLAPLFRDLLRVVS